MSDPAQTMKVDLTDLGPCRRSLSVEVPPSMVETEYEKAFRSYAGRISIAGFRQGKVPRHIVVQRFGKEIEQDVVESLIRNCSLSAIRERGLQPLHAPILKDYKFDRSAGLTFVAEFEVRPKLEPAGYRDIAVQRRPVMVSDEDIERTIERLRERRARFEPIEGRGVQDGDFVLVDVQGTFEDGRDEPLLQPEAFFESGPAGPHPEFADHLRGLSPGEERSFTVSYPEDHASVLLKGRRVAFRAQLKELKTRHLPALDDGFAREVGAGESLDELRSRIREDMTEAARLDERSEARGRALDRLLDANPGIEVPEAMVDDQVEGYIDDLMHRLAAQGIDPAEAGVDPDRARAEQREPARRSVKAMLLLDAIAEKESMEVTSAELDEALEKEARRMKQSVEALRARWKKEERLDALKRHLLREKVLDLILTPANI